MKDKDKVKILKKGGFYMYFHDNDPGAWYVLDEKPSDDEEDLDEFYDDHLLFEGEGFGNSGFCQEEVILLVAALGGDVGSE